MKIARATIFLASAAFATLLIKHSVTSVAPGMDAPETFTMPAEFEPQGAVWIGARPTENGRPAIPIVVKMVQALAPHLEIYLMVPDSRVKAEVQTVLRHMDVDAKRVHFWTSESSPTRWYRDVGAIFLKSNRGRLKVVDFDFNCYGECPTGSTEAKQKEGIDRQTAGLLHLPVMRTRLVSEGGDREVNGRGTLMVVEAVEMQRNPRLTRNQIERELLRVLGQKKTIWLKRGVAEDDKAEGGPIYGNVYGVGTGGHIDEMARFTAPDTVVLEEVTAKERDSNSVFRKSYERLEENYRILNASTDQDGHKFRIVRMPAADPIYLNLTFKPGDHGLGYFRGSKPGQPIRVILPASYMNFFISNGVVLAPAYWKLGRPEMTRRKDQVAKQILQRLFPNRTIVQIDAENLNYGGGGLHCATQQQPATP